MRSSYGEGQAPSGGSRGGAFLPSPSSGGSKSPLVCDGTTPSRPLLSRGLHLCVCVSNLPLIRTPVIMDLRVVLTQCDLILTNASAKELFPNKFVFADLGA